MRGRKLTSDYVLARTHSKVDTVDVQAVGEKIRAVLERYGAAVDADNDKGKVCPCFNMLQVIILYFKERDGHLTGRSAPLSAIRLLFVTEVRITLACASQLVCLPARLSRTDESCIVCPGWIL